MAFFFINLICSYVSKSNSIKFRRIRDGIENFYFNVGFIWKIVRVISSELNSYHLTKYVFVTCNKRTAHKEQTIFWLPIYLELNISQSISNLNIGLHVNIKTENAFRFRPIKNRSMLTKLFSNRYSTNVKTLTQFERFLCGKYQNPIAKERLKPCATMDGQNTTVPFVSVSIVCCMANDNLSKQYERDWFVSLQKHCIGDGDANTLNIHDFFLFLSLVFEGICFFFCIKKGKKFQCSRAWVCFPLCKHSGEQISPCYACKLISITPTK